MKNLDLATLGVEEMNEMQLQEVDGGLLQALAFLAGATFAVGYTIGCVWAHAEHSSK